MGKVHFAVEERAFGKFAGSRRAGAGAQTSVEHFRADQCAAVTTDLDQIFAGVTGRRAMNRHHHLIDQSARFIDNLAEMLDLRCKFRRLFFAAKNFVGGGDGTAARKTDESDGAFPGRRGDGGDSVGTGHVCLLQSKRA